MLGHGATLVLVLGVAVASQAPRPPKSPEYTDSMVPVSLQVLSHYSDQLRDAASRHGKTRKQLTELATNLVIEAKRQGVARYQGLSDSVLALMRPTSSYTATEQLAFVLRTMTDRGEVKRPDTRAVVQKARDDLADDNSDLKTGMKDLKALPYS